MTISIFSEDTYITEINMTSQLDNALNRAKESRICEILINPCKFGYMCKDVDNKTACYDKCYLDPPHCSNDGECYIDYKNNELKCRCQDTNEYVYIGEKCEIAIGKVQALSLSAKDYAIIAGAAAGAVVLIIIIVNLIKCLRKRDKKDNNSDDINSERSDLNGAEPSVHNSQMNASRNIKATFQNKAYMHASGLPELNKDIRVYRDPHTGEEALIYQPVNINKPLSSGNRELEHMQSEQTSRRSVYDYIDTENPYKIKRPNLTESRNWAL